MLAPPCRSVGFWFHNVGRSPKPCQNPHGVSDSSCFAGTSIGNKATRPAAGRAEVLHTRQGKDGSGLSTFSHEPQGTGMNWDELG